MPREILIKKYPNRRLYDTDQARYVTYTDVINRVRDRFTVKVMDRKTGQDITNQVLLQCVAEQERTNAEAARLLPVDLLHRMLRIRMGTGKRIEILNTDDTIAA